MDDDEQLSLAIALSLQEAEYLASTPPKLSQPKFARTNHDALTNGEQMLLLLGEPDEFDRNPDLQAQQLAYWQLQRDAKKARPTHTRRRRETAQVADSPVRRPVPLARYTEPPGRAQSFQSQPRRPPECASCMDQITGPARSSHCGEHHYCTECFVGMIKAALSGGTFPVQCCGKRFSQRAVAAALGTDKKMSERYFDRIEESETPNPTFCPTVDCGKLIRAQDHFACRSCHKSVCARCKKARHGGPCPDEKMDRAFEELREKEGWKNCPNCHAAVSKIRGTCNKIDCLCGERFCLHCGERYRGPDRTASCRCPLYYTDEMDEVLAENPFDPFWHLRMQPQAQAPPVRAPMQAPIRAAVPQMQGQLRFVNGPFHMPARIRPNAAVLNNYRLGHDNRGPHYAPVRPPAWDGLQRNGGWDGWDDDWNWRG